MPKPAPLKKGLTEKHLEKRRMDGTELSTLKKQVKEKKAAQSNAIKKDRRKGWAKKSENWMVQEDCVVKKTDSLIDEKPVKLEAEKPSEPEAPVEPKKEPKKEKKKTYKPKGVKKKAKVNHFAKALKAKKEKGQEIMNFGCVGGGEEQPPGGIGNRGGGLARTPPR